jgi:hypothetical protein
MGKQPGLSFCKQEGEIASHVLAVLAATANRWQAGQKLLSLLA